jgi:hypothetical protein
MTTTPEKPASSDHLNPSANDANRRTNSAEPGAYPDERDKRTPRQDGGRDITLSHKEAQAGSPDDSAVCGEEDIGVGLEFLVSDDQDHSGDENK